MEEHKDYKIKKINIWLPLLVAVVLVGGMYLGTKLQSFGHQNLASNEKTITVNSEPGRVEELIRYIEARYVDKVDSDEMVETAINTLLKDLDPHSNYISAKKLSEVNEQLDGNFEGVGIEFMILDDTVLVISPISGGPSEAVGILAGDKIISIEDTIVAGKDFDVNSVISKLRGEKGTEVRIGIKRQGEPEVLQFTITRDQIPLNSLEVGMMLNEKTGYIKLNRFSATTYREFMEKVEEMVKTHDMKDLVIDVRQNPGGYLQEATNILSQLFQEKDKLLVYTEGRNVNRNDYESTGRPFFKVANIAVLIDEGSASASEILAGAIQDHDRGVIIGRRSFGKGLVQEQYDLKDGSALRLTVARYYTPSGRSIQKSYSDIDKYDLDVIDRYSNGELYSEDSIQVEDSTQFFTASGRPVYGGGGITPDVFVALDSVLLQDEYVVLRQHVPQFVYRYYESNKDNLNFTLNDFAKSFNVSDADFESFMKYAQEKGVKQYLLPQNETKRELKRLIKARIARILYNDEGFFKIWNENDQMVQMALDHLNDYPYEMPN